MGNSFLDFMKHIGIFIICAQTMLHFVAGKSYEKYVKLLIGIIILAQFIVPVRGIFLGSSNADILGQVEIFSQEIEKNKADMAMKYEAVEITDSVEAEMKGKLEPIAEAYGYDIEKIDINDEDSKLIIKIGHRKDKNTVKIEKIEKIKIQKEQEKKEIDVQKEAPDGMREEFSKQLGVDEEYINILLE